MRVLMCQTDFFRIDLEINKWMDKKRQPDFRRARSQWQDIVKNYIQLDVEIWFIEPEPECQDMCFTANAGWCRWGKIVLSNFISPEVKRARQGEVFRYWEWFSKYRAKLLGVEVVPFPRVDKGFEGQGDVVTVDAGKNCIILVGYGQNRTDYEAAEILAQIHGLPKDRAIPLKLVDPHFYHLDTACLFIPPDTFIYYPPAFDKKSNEIIKSLPIKRLEVDRNDAYNFVCNGVFVQDFSGTSVIMNKPSLQLKTKLRNRGFKVHSVDTAEFLKSGGSIRCLTLFLPEEN